MESGREGVIPLDKERMEKLNVYFNDINLRIDLAKKIEQLQSNWNSLREYIKNKDNWYYEIDCNKDKKYIFININDVLDKMSELEKVNEYERKERIFRLVYDLLNEYDIKVWENIQYIDLANFWVEMIRETSKKYKKLDLLELEKLREDLLYEYLFKMNELEGVDNEKI